MVREHSLSDTDEGVAIFHEKAAAEIHDLDATKSRNALSAMITCLASPAPESVVEKAYATCEELEQLRQGDLRIYVKLVTDIPEYVVLWVFAVKKHRYRNLGKFDARACRKVAAFNPIESVDDVEAYLADQQALSVDELRDLKARL
ncbi:hypothetical protein [Halostella litorea]|uniref:hypothetical protein n=1 Tax=Halostella litorea TaxID=2528831 RepID=UPI001092EC65|nr:hypothetical protein [Halostella litorea]